MSDRLHVEDQPQGEQDILEEMMQYGQQAEPEPAPPPEPKREEPQRRPGGLAPMISRKRQEIIDLEKKIETHEETGVYTKKSEDGQSYFNYVAMQKDTVTLQKLNRELNELQRKDTELTGMAEQRSKKVASAAKLFLDRELAKTEERLRKPTREMFLQIVGPMLQRGEFSQQKYSDNELVRQTFDQVFSAAYGHAIRNANGGSSVRKEGAPPPGGYDERDDSQRPRNPNDEDEDDWTNNLMYAYNRKKQGSLTVAEMKRQQAEAAKKGGQ